MYIQKRSNKLVSEELEMSPKFSIKDEDLRQARSAEQEYATLQLDREQRRILEEYADYMANELDIDRIAMRGFFWMTVKDWQKQHQMPFTEFRKFDPPTRMKHLKELGEILGRRLTRFLKHPRDKDAFLKALQASLQKYEQSMMEKRKKS